MYCLDRLVRIERNPNEIWTHGAGESLTNGNERKFIPFPVIITEKRATTPFDNSIGAIQCNGTSFDLFEQIE